MTFASNAHRLLFHAAGAAAAMGLAMAVAGCTPHIGDHCNLSTDCSATGGRVCDNTQPNGYCTVLNCTNGSCPDNAVCVVFQSSVPGCAYDDYQSPSRTGRSFCMAHCSKDSDCRQSEGYICADPMGAPWHASIIDNNTSQGVCIAAPEQLDEAGANFGAQVCTPTTYDAEAFALPAPDAGPDADASPEGPDAEGDAPDDSPSVDAPTGG